MIVLLITLDGDVSVDFKYNRYEHATDVDYHKSRLLVVVYGAPLLDLSPTSWVGPLRFGCWRKSYISQLRLSYPIA